jgi:hypothetical protein
VDEERNIMGKAKSIIVYHPDAPEDPPHWEHHSTSEVGRGSVPAGYVVRVIGGFLKFT